MMCHDLLRNRASVYTSIKKVVRQIIRSYLLLEKHKSKFTVFLVQMKSSPEISLQRAFLNNYLLPYGAGNLLVKCSQTICSLVIITARVWYNSDVIGHFLSNIILNHFIISCTSSRRFYASSILII